MQIQSRNLIGRRQHGTQLQLCVPQVPGEVASYFAAATQAALVLGGGRAGGRRGGGAPGAPAGYLRNAKLQLSVVLAPADEVPGLYLLPDHRRRLRRAPVRSDLSV